MTDILASSPIRGLPVKNQGKGRGMDVGITVAMAKECMWLTVGVGLLANRYSSTMPRQHPSWGGGNQVLRAIWPVLKCIFIRVDIISMLDVFWD